MRPDQSAFVRIYEGRADFDTAFRLINRYDPASPFHELGLEAWQWFELDYDVYQHMLGALPPLDLGRGCFAMLEFTIYNITEGFFHIGDRYYCCTLEWQGNGTVAEVREALEKIVSR